MRCLYIALAMAGMLLLGLVAGSLFTRAARADNPQSGGRYQVIQVQRLDKSEPLAVVVDTQERKYRVINNNGQSGGWQ